MNDLSFGQIFYRTHIKIIIKWTRLELIRAQLHLYKEDCFSRVLSLLSTYIMNDLFSGQISLELILNFCSSDFNIRTNKRKNLKSI